MTKQEEIKKGLTDLVFCEDGSTLEEFTDKILNYLHSKGCVIKVERKLPSVDNHVYGLLNEQGRAAQRSMIKAGYVAVAPLIEKVPA